MDVGDSQLGPKRVGGAQMSMVEAGYELLGLKQCGGHRGQVVRLDRWLV